LLKLLFLRAVPLVLRPVVILMEGFLVAGGNILVLTLPVAMMALTISSIPVHIDYYRADKNSKERITAGEQYVSGLICLICLSLVVLASVLYVADVGLHGWLIVATCLLFLIEKQADEVSRILEFRKAFGKWFLVQSARSGWMLVPIVASAAGQSYQVAFVASSSLVAAAFVFLFFKVTGLPLVVGRSGLTVIRAKLIYLVGSFLPASYRQLPRILVTRLFPEQAHIYLATAQLTQAVGLLFNIRFQIPYRRVIARKTRLFQKRARPAMLRLLLVPAVIVPVWMVGAPLIPDDRWTGFILALVLCPLLVADALMYAILTAHLGYLPWFERRSRVFISYVINIVLLVVLLMVYQWALPTGELSTVAVVSGFNLLGFAWLGVLLARHFSLRRPLASK
jgi:hypothetical protein